MLYLFYYLTADTRSYDSRRLGKINFIDTDARAKNVRYSTHRSVGGGGSNSRVYCEYCK